MAGLLLIAIALAAGLGTVSSLLYPYESQSRERRYIYGLWDFKAEEPNSLGVGFASKWYMKDISLLQGAIKMPVPSAYNDVTQSKKLRESVGWVWYQKSFRLPPVWKNRRVVLRFDSVNYFASVWVNGEFLGNHTGGHLPFEFDINSLAKFGNINSITVAVNNTLSHSTIPPGEFVYKKQQGLYPPGWFEQTVDFDFFNYAGILRFVSLYVTPVTYISDVTIVPDVIYHMGVIEYSVNASGVDGDVTVATNVALRDKQNKMVIQQSGTSGRLVVPNPHLWWPIGMANETAYLYSLEITLTDSNNTVIDVYQLTVGIRSIKVTSTQFLVNGVPFYFKGLGMHEDAEIRGRGFDSATMMKDLNLLEWLGANSFRTSVYPYAEEMIIEADRRGIVVIGETPAVGVRYFTSDNLMLHEQMLTDFINRDKNHPSVFMWSIANEPLSQKSEARDYFKSLVSLAHSMDPSRPVTINYDSMYLLDKTADLVDVICLNRYEGWYFELGHTELIENLVELELIAWHQKYGIPVMMSEYGATSITGLNTDPPAPFTESYQAVVAKDNYKAFDKLRLKFLIGEMIWCLADFMTPQIISRVDGNRQGVLTRSREPKMAAYILKERYESLNYTSRSNQCRLKATFTFTAVLALICIALSI